MKFIQGFDRNQIQFFAYEQLISPDSSRQLSNIRSALSNGKETFTPNTSLNLRHI
ncbi:MAG: hypothetical protein ACK5L7_02845 [Paludibacteraceae bacterium]